MVRFSVNHDQISLPGVIIGPNISALHLQRQACLLGRMRAAPTIVITLSPQAIIGRLYGSGTRGFRQHGIIPSGLSNPSSISLFLTETH